MNGGDTIVEANTDWNRLDAMTDAEVHAAALSDPDAQPTTEAHWAPETLTPRVKVMRRAFGLSVEEFSQRYHIPVATIRDWEERRSVPDPVAHAYLYVIAKNPDLVGRTLETRGKIPGSH